MSGGARGARDPRDQRDQWDERDAGAVVLAVNCGSTSIKAAVVVDGEERARVGRDLDPAEAGAAAGAVADEVLAAAEVAQPDAVGHRIVHGGPGLVEHAVVDGAVRERLEAARPFAPLHLPPALGALDALRDRWPDLAQVACLDTAFFADLPELSRRLPLPDRFDRRGIRRYGFHGLSYEWVVGELGAGGLGRRAVVAHLGGGSSLAALLDGRPVHTTMGLTPTGGLLMGTRTGDLDPGALLHLLRAEGCSVEEVAELVDHEGGVAALSGGTSDMRALQDAADAGEDRATFAREAYVRSVAMGVAAGTAVLGGLDSLTFTGGIGEHDPEVRSGVRAALAHLGAGEGGPVAVRVVADDEEAVMARHTVRLAGLDAGR